MKYVYETLRPYAWLTYSYNTPDELMSLWLQVSMAVLWLSYGSYLLNLAMSIWIQLSIILLAHPSIQFNVGNRAN